MKPLARKEHSVENLFSVVLFGLFVLFLLLMILFCAQAYRAAVRGAEENSNLRTAQTYVTTKFRQHDTEGGVFIKNFQDENALCFKDIIEGQEYITYIYLKDRELKELFTASLSDASLDMGTTVAALTDFRAQQTEEGYLKITMEDADGKGCCFLLHPGPPD